MPVFMNVLHLACSVMVVLPAAVWLGGLVVLGLSTRVIDSALRGRRTEGRQIIRRLREIFQRIELVAVLVLWVFAIARLLLPKLIGESYPGTWDTPDAIALGLLVVATALGCISTFYVTRAIRRHEAALGSYADKNEQIRTRKSIAALMRESEMLTWFKAGLVAAMVVGTVMGMA